MFHLGCHPPQHSIENPPKLRIIPHHHRAIHLHSGECDKPMLHAPAHQQPTAPTQRQGQHHNNHYPTSIPYHRNTIEINTYTFFAKINTFAHTSNISVFQDPNVQCIVHSVTNIQTDFLTSSKQNHVRHCNTIYL